jgi:ankyrin repeat protein
VGSPHRCCLISRTHCCFHHSASSPRRIVKVGWTPLHYAALGRHLAVAGALLAKGAYMDAKNNVRPLEHCSRKYTSPAAQHSAERMLRAWVATADR